MKLKPMPLPADVTYIINKLCEAGFRADVVGGAVRDFLLGKTPGDYDITTSATPDEMLSVFSGDRVVRTGLQHGTVSVILSHTAYEVTSYRIDGEYDDARHPSAVKFTRDITEDLARRDFTVNALAYNPTRFYTDAYGGIADLEAGVIRAVGVAETRFSEDALRILRAIRFASVLDFKIEAKTAQALYTCAPLLSKISRERIYTEWMKLLSGKAAYAVLAEYSSLVGFFIPELASFSLPSREKFDDVSAFLRFVSLFRDKGSACFDAVMRSLRSDTSSRERGIVLLDELESPLISRTDMKRMLGKIGEEATAELLELRALFDIPTAEGKNLYTILSSGECYSLSSLAVDGNDLISLGYKGRELGAKLALLLDAVMDEKVPNEKSELIMYLTHI